MYHLQIIVDSCTLSFLPLLCLVARVSILSGKLFSLNYFSVPVLVSGRSLRWFPHFRVAMDTSLQPMEFGTPLTFKVQYRPWALQHYTRVSCVKIRHIARKFHEKNTRETLVQKKYTQKYTRQYPQIRKICVYSVYLSSYIAG